MLLIDLVQNKCPQCRKGRVYRGNNLATFSSMKMEESCPICGKNFTKDPGFYWGSMYVSYALAMLQALGAYLVCQLLGAGRFDMVNLIAIIAVILLCGPFNFRMARLVWLYLFPNV